MLVAATTETSYSQAWGLAHQRCLYASIEPGLQGDIERSAYLRTRWNSEPDEALRADPTAIECAVCHRPFRKRYRGKSPKLCGLCRSKGWTAALCECGRPLHRREQTSQSGLSGRCGKCRREIIGETHPERMASVVVAEPPPPPLFCMICGGPKATRQGKKCRACDNKACCRCGGVMSRHMTKCSECRRYE